MPNPINPHYQGQRNFNAYDQATPSNQNQFKANVAIDYEHSTGVLTITPTGLVANSAQYYQVNVSQGDIYFTLTVNLAIPQPATVKPVANKGIDPNKPVELLFEARGVENGTQAERITGSHTFADLTVDRTVTFNNL